MDNSTGIINFDTPYEYLDPQEAYQTAVSSYLQIAALGALVWDTVDNLPFDLKLLFTNRPSISSLAYFGSRIGTLGYVVGAAIFGTASTGNCERFEKVDDAFYPISIGFSGLLFFLRLRAIYNDNRIVVASFFVLWCGLLVSTIFIPVALLGGAIDPNGNYCTDINLPPSIYAAVTMPLVNDTLVFIAISWRLSQVSHLDGSLKDNMKVALFGTYLPSFSRSLLLDGQRYYLISLISNLVTVITGSVTAIPIELRSMCVTPNVALVSIMACRVFRRTRTGAFRETEISTTALTGQHKPRQESTGIVFAPISHRTNTVSNSGTQGPTVSNFTNPNSSYHIDITHRPNSQPSSDDQRSSQEGKISTKSLADVEKGL